MSINQADIDTNQSYFVGALFNRGANTRINLRVLMVFNDSTD